MKLFMCLVRSELICETVKARFDYTATDEEEFDFRGGDVIAVTATPDNGWWSGELLDEARRVEGRNVFPRNFVRPVTGHTAILFYGQ